VWLRGLRNGQKFHITGRTLDGLRGQMMGTSFQVVLSRTRDGDPSAFAVLWREYQPSLLRYLRVTARDAAEDVASETWAAVATSIARFDGDETAFRAWLFTVARRRAVDHFRREARRPSVPVDPLTLRGASIEAQGADPGDTAVRTLDTEAALRRIAELPPGQRDAVMLRAIAGLDVAHVAAIMGKRPGTVRVLAHRGLRTLALRLADEERAVTP
jgi:RNA polymerase sigma-70 factor (ECF subfamily)